MAAHIDSVLDAYVDRYGENAGLILLQTIADRNAGGLGYSIEIHPFIDLDGWEVDEARRLIKLDSTFWGKALSTSNLAKNLNEAIETKITKVREGLVSRIAWGSGKVIFGVIETGVGVIGIIVPEPGTTTAGVVVTALGVNTITDGITQLSGANRGRGINILGEGAGVIGAAGARLAGADPTVGEAIGKGIFLVSSVAVGSLGSVRILHIPGTSVTQFATRTVKGTSGGATIGRLNMAYPSSRAGDGMTIININNNAGQSILRFVTHSGQLQANGRIVGVEKILRHTPAGKEMLKGLLKLARHGFIKGL
ncbi:hypothetical protein [Fulvimarina sp. MAC3]|uniref:hypothetical protein n=1 Tax=Fulvimarina sp. MAC3 TaxID=3148887 RepID=UPI0031FE01D9